MPVTESRLDQRKGASRAAALTAALTLPAVAVAGYHPYAEDGGVYVAGVKKLLDPSLYPAWTKFVTEHLRFSVYAPMVAGIAGSSHAPLAWVLFGLYCASVWATLFAGWMVISRATLNARARTGAVALLACWLTLPIAGTSLMLMDPYLTARSISTPLVLIALAWAMDGTGRGWGMCAAALAVAAVMHPLMAGFGFAAVAVLLCVNSKSARVRRVGPAILAATAVLVAGLVQAEAPAETPEYWRVERTRYYWFPFLWHWYEWVGLLLPLLLLWLRRGGSSARRSFAMCGMVLGGTALAVAMSFSQEHYATHLVARLQPLRSFQIVYELMILLLGAWLGARMLKSHAGRWGLVFLALGGVMFFAQRRTYPNSAHIEWPWEQSVNPWEQAFVWAREHTPKDDLFALDARYITQGRHEDAQCFRAIAERSALPDYSKDGGEAAITPALADAWTYGQIAQSGLEEATDAVRLKQLRPFGVAWVVLEAPSLTAWSCPYANATVKVCRLP